MNVIGYALSSVLNLIFSYLMCWPVLNWLTVLLFTVDSDSDRATPNDFDPRSQTLPRWLSWITTFDAPLDAGWVDGYYGSRYYTYDNPPPWFKRKFWQIRWLYRNTGYGFSYWALGAAFWPEDWSVEYTPATTDRGEIFKATNKVDPTLFNYYEDPKYKLGWKVWNYWDTETGTWKINADGSAYRWGPKARIPLCFSPTFWRSK